MYLILAVLLDQCNSRLIYEHSMQSQVLYVVPITSILGRLALVPVGAAGTIQFSMHKETGTFPGASCDLKKGAVDCNRWWYINNWHEVGHHSMNCLMAIVKKMLTK